MEEEVVEEVVEEVEEEVVEEAVEEVAGEVEEEVMEEVMVVRKEASVEGGVEAVVEVGSAAHLAPLNEARLFAAPRLRRIAGLPQGRAPRREAPQYNGASVQPY